MDQPATVPSLHIACGEQAQQVVAVPDVRGRQLTAGRPAPVLEGRGIACCPAATSREAADPAHLAIAEERALGAGKKTPMGRTKRHDSRAVQLERRAGCAVQGGDGNLVTQLDQRAHLAPDAGVVLYLPVQEHRDPERAHRAIVERAGHGCGQRIYWRDPALGL